MGWMGLWWLVILAAIGAAIWFTVAAPKRRGQERETPEQILKRRYANGEIDRQTYERMLDELRQ